MALFFIGWILGLVAYFKGTTEDQRKAMLLVTWMLMLLPSLYWVAKLLS